MNKRGLRANDHVRATVAWMWSSWNEALAKHTTRQDIPMPPELTDNGLPIRKSSLVARMCKWVDEGYFPNRRAGIPECMLQWQRVLKRVKTTNLLRNGYKNLPDPSLYWLFKGPRDERGIDKVLEGKYDDCLAPQFKQARRLRRWKRKVERHVRQTMAKPGKEQQVGGSGEHTSVSSLGCSTVNEVADGPK
jgi:hypothetical protein